MKQALYIKSACSISPQHSYDAAMFANPVVSSDSGSLFVTEQDYRKYISPVAIRRMSRLLKMSITAGMQCLDDAGAKPDGIITGTGRGSVSDMEHFLRDMIELKEQALNPTFFIQSTYNSVNGWLALQTKCTCYNQTFVHRGLSFELALLDAQLCLAEADSVQNILVGGFDEMTEYYHIVKNKVGYWKQEKINSIELLQHCDTSGTIGGEGASFFTMSNEGSGAVSIVQDIAILNKPGTAELQNAITDMLERNGLTVHEIDLLLSGNNGDVQRQACVEAVTQLFEERTGIAAFKHLSGDFDTASGFGLWLADHIIKQQAIPDICRLKKVGTDAINKVLMVNHTIQGDASIILLQRNGIS